MFLKRLLLVSLILSPKIVSSLSSDLVHLRQHFIANLIEENREISSFQLTEDIESNINRKIEGFLNIISPPTTRPTRNTNDLLLNEKTTDIFILKGFQRRGFIPINFPQDICMFQVDRKIFAVGWTRGKAANSTSKATLMIFAREDGKFNKIHTYESKHLTKIDCKATLTAGYIVVVNAVADGAEDYLLQHGSFVYRVTSDKNVEIAQKFTFANQNGARLWLQEQTLFLVFSYDTTATSPLNACTVFTLTDTTFNPIDDLPCQNARAIEFFTVHHHLMVLIGNYRENNGTTNTFSTLMRYNLDQKRFVEHQKIFTNAVVVAKYFFLDHQEQRQHFLFIGNSFEINEYGVINYDVPSMIYRFVNGFFIPMQTISVRHVQAVQEIIGKNSEFHFLIASEDNEVQIYFYDGWKFQESPIDFTGDAFGAGVVSIKAYNDIIKDESTVVISNQDSFEPTFNVYTPIYSVKNDTSKLKSSISKWCEDSFERLSDFDVDEAEETLQAAMNLADAESDRADFLGKVFLKNSTIKTIKTNQLRGTRVKFNNETAQRYTSLYNRVAKLNSAAQHISNKIKFTKATQRTKRQTSTLIKNLTVDGLLNVKSINGRPVTDLVYTSNRRNTQLKDVVANEIFITNQLFVNGKIDGVELSEDNVLLNRPRQVLRPFKIDSLTVNSLNDVAVLNQVPFAEFFTLLRRKVDMKIPNFINQLTVDSLTVKNFINQRNFTAMAINSMKITGDQIVLAPMTVNQLTAKSVRFQKVLRDQRISNIPIGTLIDIKDTRRRHDIIQDIRFTSDLAVNNLKVLERINNINVKGDNLQVLRKTGLQKQVVTAEKFFENVQLLTPIVLQGKIESKTLKKMNPIVTVNENLMLDGDYVISGPVTIRRVMNATEDIVTVNPELGLKKLSEKGLNLFTTSKTNNKIVFKNVVEVKGNLQATSLNQKPIANFVKTNIADLQVVQGETTFKNGLLVNGGTVQADVINDVDVNHLNNTILKRFSDTPQFIDGNAEFSNLKVEQIVSPKVNINGRSFELVVNTNKPQELSQVTLNAARITNLNAGKFVQSSGGKIFTHDLNSIIDDTVTSSSSADVVVAEKKFSNLTVERLTFAEGNVWKSIINNYENSIAQELNFTENLIFPKQMQVKNLVVKGTINGVSPDDMMNNWLQIEGDQIFTAPQTIALVSVEKNLIVKSGEISGVDIGKKWQETIFIDDPMFIENVKIEGDFVVRGKVWATTVNGVDLTEKLFLNNTDEVQTIKKIEVAGNAAVEFMNFTTINGIKCEEFTQVFAGDSGAENLLVKGAARFNVQPKISNLNNENLQQLSDSVWLADRDVVLTGHDIKFLGGIRSDGELRSDFINKKELDNFYQNYMSLTTNQIIPTFLNVSGSVIVKKALFAEKTVVPGLIRTDVKDKGMKIDDFAQNILRKGREQTISAPWTLKKLVIHGNFNKTINGLYFSDDVLHNGNVMTAEITGSKKFLFLETFDFVAPLVNGVDIHDWITNAIYLNTENDDQIIDGKIQLASAVFYNDLEVYGVVNGRNFNPSTVLLKSADGQVINGDLTIRTMNNQDVKSLFIENLFLHEINGKNLKEIQENSLKIDDTEIDSIEFVFEKKLTVGKLETNKSIFGVNMAQLQEESDASGRLMKFQSDLEYLTRVGQSLKASFNDVPVELNHFELHQTLLGENVQKTVLLAILPSDYILASHERNLKLQTEVIRFYRFDRGQGIFVDDGSIQSIIYSSAVYQITRIDKIVFKAVDHLFVELFDKTSSKFLQTLMRFDPITRLFITEVTTESSNSIQLFTLDNGLSACYGSVLLSLENINIICEGTPITVLQTARIRMVSSQNEIIILLTDDRKLQIWNSREKLQDLSPAVMNPQAFASVKHDGKFYLAVISGKIPDSIHHGSVEVYESDEKIRFRHVQSIDLYNPITLQFSEIPTGDLLLYVLTENPVKPLSVFRFEGASFFGETIDNSTISIGRDLNTMNIDGRKHFIPIVSGNISIIEAVIKEH